MHFISVFSIVSISLALVFYTIGIWAERVSRYLRRWHLVFFWLGFAFDVTGTVFMHLLAEDPFTLKDSHTLSGQLALWLMLTHAIWASIVVSRDMEGMKMIFHRYSLFVWLVWLIPYFGGMFMAMR